MMTFRPSTGTPEQWSVAHARLEDYLRAHGFSDSGHQTAVLLQLLARAAARHREDPSQPPVRLALREAEDAMTEWFSEVLTIEIESSGRFNRIGKARLYLTGAMDRWPRSFLDATAIPSDLIAAMRQTSIVTGPVLNVSTMVPRSIQDERGFFEEAWDSLLTAPLLSLAALGGAWEMFGRMNHG